MSWDNINSQNRKLIDPTSHRYYYVPEPIVARITGVQKEFAVNAPLHPQHPEMGTRVLIVTPRNSVVTLYLAGSDMPILESVKAVRLMGLFNFRRVRFDGDELSGEFVSEDGQPAESAPIIQWVPSDENVNVDVVMPDATTKRGVAEKGLVSEPPGSIIQFVRFGFGRVDQVSTDEATVYFAHQ
jgi:glutamyl-tRNA synthetase